MINLSIDHMNELGNSNLKKLLNDGGKEKEYFLSDTETPRLSFREFAEKL